MMKIGLDTECFHMSLRNGRSDIFDFIENVVQLGLDGVMINVITFPRDRYTTPSNWGSLGGDSPEHLEEVRIKLEKYGLYAELATRGTDPAHLAQTIEIAHKIGADVVRTYCCLNGYDPVRLEKAQEDIKKIIHLLEKYNIKLSIENHEDETADEIINIIKKVNNSLVGAHCDIGNSMMAWEDPVNAVKKLAPSAFSTHFKDHIIIADDTIFKVCGVPVGQGNIDTESCFKELVAHSNLKRITIEMCYPYIANFKRQKGTGGVFDVGTGAFAVRQLPFAKELLAPENYYYPPEEWIPLLIEEQARGVKLSVQHVLKLRDKYAPLTR